MSKKIDKDLLERAEKVVKDWTGPKGQCGNLYEEIARFAQEVSQEWIDNRDNWMAKAARLEHELMTIVNCPEIKLCDGHKLVREKILANNKKNETKG